MKASAMRLSVVLLVQGGLLVAQAPHPLPESHLDLPTSKAIVGVVPGSPQRINNLPMSMAVSPDKRYVVTVNAGYGSAESQFEQSIAVLDTATGQITDFPDDRTLVNAKQTLYSGLAFSHDGKHLYASMGSISKPEGDGAKAVGNAVVVYGFAEGKITPERLIPLPLQALAQGRRTLLPGSGSPDKGIPFPAAIAAVAGKDGAERLLVAGNLSDDVLLLNPADGKIETRFDLSESDAVPSTYPVDIVVAKDGRRAFVASVECLRSEGARSG